MRVFSDTTHFRKLAIKIVIWLRWSWEKSLWTSTCRWIRLACRFLLAIVKFRSFAAKSARISLKNSHNFGQNRAKKRCWPKCCDSLSEFLAGFAANDKSFTIASKIRHASRIQRHALVHKLFSQLQRSQITIFMADFRKCVISENMRILRIFAQKNIILKHTKCIILAIYYLLQYITCRN